VVRVECRTGEIDQDGLRLIERLGFHAEGQTVDTLAGRPALYVYAPTQQPRSH
jgi:hypothetical protein